MAKKFTEEQYQKIVEIADGYIIDSDFGIMGDIIQKPIGAEFYETDLSVEIDFQINAEEIMVIANPLTREWGHDHFVEKEKKYFWKRNGLYLTKDNFDGSIIFDSYKSLFTESEIIFWGYNPKMFDKEEV